MDRERKAPSFHQLIKPLEIPPEADLNHAFLPSHCPSIKSASAL